MLSLVRDRLLRFTISTTEVLPLLHLSQRVGEHLPLSQNTTSVCVITARPVTALKTLRPTHFVMMAASDLTARTRMLTVFKQLLRKLRKGSLPQLRTKADPCAAAAAGHLQELYVRYEVAPGLFLKKTEVLRIYMKFTSPIETHLLMHIRDQI